MQDDSPHVCAFLQPNFDPNFLINIKVLLELIVVLRKPIGIDMGYNVEPTFDLAGN